MRFLPLAALAGLLACAGTSTPDQPAPAGERRLVFEHTFTAPGPEQARVDLVPGTYRAETSQGGVQLRLRPLRSGVQPPTIREVVMGRGVTGGGTWELIVHVEATYEIEVTGGRPGESAVLRIFTWDTEVDG